MRRRYVVTALGVAFVVFLLVLAGTGCGDHVSALQAGTRVDPPSRVSQVTLPDVSSEARGWPFLMRAAATAILLVFFGYTTCPDICPTTLATIRTALAGLDPANAARVEVAFVTVDLARDTPPGLNDFLETFLRHYHALHASSARQLRTAERPFHAAHRITRSRAGVSVVHTATLYAVDDRGRGIAIWSYGTQAKPLAHDLEQLLNP